MLTYILLGLFGLFVLLLVVIALQPNAFRIERQATIPAPASEIFPHVADFRKWPAWSPWETIDPNLKRTYSGSASGIGAVYDWSGNNNVGQGRMTILECRPDELIRIRLEFFKPFKGVNTTEFKFAPIGERQTRVTWSMCGPKNYLSKALHMLFSMEKMIGGKYEKGLENLHEIVNADYRIASPAKA